MSAPKFPQEGVAGLRSGHGQAILIDFDRTLVNLYPDRKAPFRLRGRIITQLLNMGIDPSLLEPFAPIEDGYHLWSELATSWRGSPHAAALRSLEGLFFTTEMEASERCEIASGALDLVRAGKSCGAAIAVVTSNHGVVVNRALQRHGLRKYVDEVVGRPVPMRPEVMKPSSFPIYVALRALGLDEPSRAHLIGDSIVDMAAASEAGCHAVGVATGDYTKRQLLDGGAQVAVTDLTCIRLESLEFEVVLSGE